MKLSRAIYRLLSISAGSVVMLTASLGTTMSTYAATSQARPLCDDNNPLCSETANITYNYEGKYIGHDEPSVLFYSDQAGSGNSDVYQLVLPKDPPRLPTQNGKGGTFNFQLHPAFWFGMAMCDTQSAPEFTSTCIPDSDTNIFDSPDPNAPDYIGHHPGTAFMEMQFYPPGWVDWPAGNSCGATRWCAALNIDSLGEDQNNGILNNNACASTVGLETVNFAFITKSGIPQAPANPVDSTLATFTPDPSKDLMMSSGDRLAVSLHDTANGLQIVIQDLTTHQTGSMTASAANGFGQVKFDPTGTTCQNIPYDFHPMYSTSSEHTRVPWTAHSYNISYSDEIGHFEYCNAVDANGNCTSAGVNEPDGQLDADDTVFCFPASASSRIRITGCINSDIDFDGVPYGLNWPGTFTNVKMDRQFHPSPIEFSSPLFWDGSSGKLTNYNRVGFEADLPRIELNGNPPCNRQTGANCTNPPLGAAFYPFFSTRDANGGMCLWQEGGAHIPGTINSFGGSSTTEFGSLLQLFYPNVGGPLFLIEDFRQVLSNNPCPSVVPGG